MAEAKKKQQTDEMSIEENYENVDYSVEEAEYFLKKAKAAAKVEQAETDCNVPSGTIIATSDSEGMSWCCNAESDQVIKHVISTIEAAEKTLEDSPIKLMLSLMIAQHMSASMSK